MVMACLMAGGLAGPGLVRQPQAAPPATTERIAIEESLRAGFPPSLALAVAQVNESLRVRGGPRRRDHAAAVAPWDTRARARRQIARLQRLIRDHHGHWDRALTRFYLSGADVAGSGAATRAYVRKVLRLQRRYRRQASLWTAALKGPTTDWPGLRPGYHKVLQLAALARAPDVLRSGRHLDDFGPAIEMRRRSVRRGLDDFSASPPRRDIVSYPEVTPWPDAS